MTRTTESVLFLFSRLRNLSELSSNTGISEECSSKLKEHRKTKSPDHEITYYKHI